MHCAARPDFFFFYSNILPVLQSFDLKKGRKNAAVTLQSLKKKMLYETEQDT